MYYLLIFRRRFMCVAEKLHTKEKEMMKLKEAQEINCAETK